MSKVSSCSADSKFTVALGQKTTLVPYAPLPQPRGLGGRSESQRSGAFLIMDPMSKLPSLKDKTPSVEPPLFLELKNLANRSLRQLAGGAGALCAVTDDGEFLAATSVVTEERNGNLKFGTLSAFELLDVVAVDCGAEHTIVCAFNHGRLVVLGMGNNVLGQLGMGSRVEYTERFRPIKFPTSPRFVDVVCGSFFTMLLTHTGDVWAFGHNSYGQLGIGKWCEKVSEPVICQTLKGIPVTALAAGSMHALVLTTTGLVYGTGSNQHGQLGLERRENRNEFSAVSTLENVFLVRIAAYGSYSAAIDEFGTFYIWGGKYGHCPKSMILDEGREKVVDMALGADGRVCVLTNRKRLLVSGYYVNDGQVQVPVEISSPLMPFIGVYGGGDYFMVIADKSKPLPMGEMPPKNGRALLPPMQAPPKHKLRAPEKILALSSRHFPDFLMMDGCEYILRTIFSSLGSLNGSFLVDNFSESLSDVCCGMDIAGIISAYGLIMQNKDLMMALTQSFSRLLTDTLEEPPSIRGPSTMRFLMIGLLHPSPIVFREGFDFWVKLVQIMRKMNAYSVFAQWFSVVTKDQLEMVLQSLKDLLTTVVCETRRLYSQMVADTVKALEVIWFASTRSKLLPFDAFYHQSLNEMIDVVGEYQVWVSGEKNWCFTRRAPWLLNADTKTKFLRINSREMMNRQQISAMQNATQFWGTVPVVTPLDLFLIIQVDRKNLITDTFQAIAGLKNPDIDLKKPLKILFKNEPGVDEGGVQREFFELIIQELFDEQRGLFTNNKDVYWFNTHSTDPAALQAYYLTGIIFGLAIYNGNLLNVRFPLVAYKKLRGFNVSFDDLADFDAELMSSFKSVLDYDGDVENDLCLTFEYGGHPICDGGENRAVTNENRAEYIDTLTRYILVDSIAMQFEQFKHGFLQAAGTIVLDIFRPEEIALLIAGREELDFVALEKATRYEDYSPDSPTVRTFWKIVHTRLTDDEKKRLLYFVTATPRAPINGLGSVPFVIARDGDPNHIPTSHTCFFMLVLPDDPDEERLYKKLKIAIDNSEGFAFK